MNHKYFNNEALYITRMYVSFAWFTYIGSKELYTYFFDQSVLSYLHYILLYTMSIRNEIITCPFAWLFPIKEQDKMAYADNYYHQTK